MSQVSKNDILRQILQLGSSSSEFTANTSSETDLVIERKIVDAEYYKVVGKEGLKETYKAYLLLDESRRHLARHTGTIGLRFFPH